MPILKQLILGSSGSKRRSRADLTVEMISAPLADFRHTMHIGRGGDAFGDTSFLDTPHESTNQVQKNGLLPRRFRGSKRSHSHKEERHSSDTSYMLPANSAVSLPYVNEDQDTAWHLPKSTSLNFPEMSGKLAVMGGRGLEMEEQSFGEPSELPMFTPPSGRIMKRSESILSFHVDLGPSMLGDVLGVMDQTEQDHRGLMEEQRHDWKVPVRNVSTPSSGLEEEKTQTAQESENGSTTYGVNINDKDFLFMDEDEDEIRV